MDQFIVGQTYIGTVKDGGIKEALVKSRSSARITFVIEGKAFTRKPKTNTDGEYVAGLCADGVLFISANHRKCTEPYWADRDTTGIEQVGNALQSALLAYEKMVQWLALRLYESAQGRKGKKVTTVQIRKLCDFPAYDKNDWADLTRQVNRQIERMG